MGDPVAQSRLSHKIDRLIRSNRGIQECVAELQGEPRELLNSDTTIFRALGPFYINGQRTMRGNVIKALVVHLNVDVTRQLKTCLSRFQDIDDGNDDGVLDLFLDYGANPNDENFGYNKSAIHFLMESRLISEQLDASAMARKLIEAGSISYDNDPFDEDFYTPDIVAIKEASPIKSVADLRGAQEQEYQRFRNECISMNIGLGIQLLDGAHTEIPPTEWIPATLTDVYNFNPADQKVIERVQNLLRAANDYGPFTIENILSVESAYKDSPTLLPRILACDPTLRTRFPIQDQVFIGLHITPIDALKFVHHTPPLLSFWIAFGVVTEPEDRRTKKLRLTLPGGSGGAANSLVTGAFVDLCTLTPDSIEQCTRKST
jgi:hypothetical protein